MFCNIFSESSTDSWAELQLPFCPSKQGELSENIFLNLLPNLPPQTVELGQIPARHGVVRLRVAERVPEDGGEGVRDGERRSSGQVRHDRERGAGRKLNRTVFLA